MGYRTLYLSPPSHAPLLGNLSSVTRNRYMDTKKRPQALRTRHRQLLSPQTSLQVLRKGTLQPSRHRSTVEEAGYHNDLERTAATIHGNGMKKPSRPGGNIPVEMNPHNSRPQQNHASSHQKYNAGNGTAQGRSSRFEEQPRYAKDSKRLG